MVDAEVLMETIRVLSRKLILASGLGWGAWQIIDHRTPGADVADLRTWVDAMLRAQNEMLKVDWGKPGFCTKF